MIGYLCKSLRIISLVWPTRLIFLAMGEVLSFGFNLAVSLPSDNRGSKARNRRPRGRGARPTLPGAPPPLWAPCCSTNVLLPPIYTYVPPNQHKHPRKPNSTAATFYTREIPSWGLFRRPAGGGIDHEELLHQHHSFSDDV